MASQAEVDLVISTEGALPELERDLQRIIRTAEDGAETLDLQAAIDVGASLAVVAGDLERIVQSAENGAEDIDLQAALDSAQSLERVQHDLEVLIDRASRGEQIDVRAELDQISSLAQVSQNLRSVIRQVEAVTPPIEVQVDVDRDGRLARVLPLLGRGLLGLGRSTVNVLGSLGRLTGALGAVSLAGASLAPVLAGVVSAVQNIAPASALAVSGLLTVQLAANTFKLAMVGVEDAVKAALDPGTKPKELAEALEKLSPNARAFVLELRDMRSAFKEIQQGVQDNFFEGFAEATRDLGKTVLPVLKEQLFRASGELNAMALGAAEAASKMGKNGTLGKALDGAVKGLFNLNKVPGQIVQGLLQIGAAAAPAFGRVTKAAGTAATRISEKLNKSFESGALEKSVDKAVEALKQLGRVFKNIFEGIGNVIEGFQTQGDGLFGTLEKVSRAFADVTASKGFQQVLQALVTTMGVIVSTVLPLLMQAFQALGPVLLELAGPVQEFVKALGVALSEIIPALAPLLLKMAEAFGKILVALAPVVVQIGFLVAALLTGLTPIIKPILDLVVELVNAGLNVLADSVKRFVLPALQILVAFMNGDLKTALRGTKALFIDVATSMTEQTLDMGGQVENGFKKVARVGNEQTSILKNSVIQGIGIMVRDTIALVSTLPGQLVDSLQSAAAGLFSVGQDMIRGLINGIRSQLGALRQVAEDAANAVSGAVRGLLGIHSPSRVMMEVGDDTMEGFRLGIRGGIPDLRRELQGVASLAPSFALPGGQTLSLPSASDTGTGTPTVQVFLGNQLLNQHIDTRITSSNQARDRLVVQGVRR